MLPRLLLVLCLFPPLAFAAPLTVVDDLQRSVSLPDHARRIVSLAPYITELLYEAGAGDKVVATVEHSDYPPQAAGLPRIGDFQAVDFEALLALKPDLVIAWGSGTRRALWEKIESLGIPVFLSEPRALEDIADTLKRFGRLAASTQIAQKTADEYTASLRMLRRRHAAKEVFTVFYAIWHRPLMTVNGRHMISHALRVCGVENAFNDLGPLTAEISAEALFSRRIQAIVAGERVMSDLKGTVLPKVPVLSVDDKRLHRQTPRILEAIDELCVSLDKLRRQP